MQQRTIIAILGLFVVIMLGLGLLLYTSAQRARVQAEQMAAEARLQAERARVESARAETLNELLVEVLTSVEAEDAAADGLLLSAMLDHAAARLDKTALDPEVERRIRETIERARTRLREESRDGDASADGSPPAAERPQTSTPDRARR